MVHLYLIYKNTNQNIQARISTAYPLSSLISTFHIQETNSPDLETKLCVMELTHCWENISWVTIVPLAIAMKKSDPF